MKVPLSRIMRLMPGGVPRWVRCYDNGGATYDRYTVVFTGNFSKAKSPDRAEYPYLTMSANPFHPQGFGQHGTTTAGPCDRPRSAHLGKRIAFTDLPEQCRAAALYDYRCYWRICGGCDGCA